MPVIGFMSSRSPEDSVLLLEAFRRGLKDGGFVEGGNVAIEFRWARGNYDQLPALAEAGFHAVAPDMRGYGQTERPDAIDQYTLFHLVGDMVGLLDALGAAQAVIAGHDWGAPVAWHAALMRPDRFLAAIGLSVPFIPRGPDRPTGLMPQTEDAVFYQLYFQTPGVAEAELEHDIRRFIRATLYSISGDMPRCGPAAMMVPRQGGLQARWASEFVNPATLPSWLTEADVDFYAGEFTRTGFGGGLNWYRNIDRNWELLAPFTGARVTVPALYVAGDRDLVVAFRGMDQVIANLSQFVPHPVTSGVLPLQYQSGSGVIAFPPAAKILGTIISTPRPGIAIGDVGVQALASPGGVLPSMEGMPGVTVEALHDEHIVLRTDGTTPLHVGDQFLLHSGQQDILVNRWDQYIAVRHGVVEAVWDIPARGCHH